jgi:serine/threonine-protein kinase
MTTSSLPKQDTQLGRSLVSHGICTRQEVDDCLAMLRESQAGDSNRSLAGLLLSNGYVTQTQLDRLRNPTEEPSPVKQIPGYQILSKLGAGAMATVYKARQISLDRTVAVKVLPKRMSDNREFVERFYKEGKAAAKLNHPNIVGAVDVGEANGYHYFVMEYVEGVTVFDRLDRGEAYPEKEALHLIMQVCRALVHAHEAGFIHRDVKPKNIMITPQGIAKLADMGLARETNDQAAAMAEAGKAYGTPYYISPEQIRGELNIDARADIYSLGATLYHMVTGRVPFDAPTPSAVMHKHLKEELIPPDHIVPSLSAGLGEIVETAMAKRRKNRYASAADMLADLERIAAGEPPLVARRGYDLDSLADLEKNSSGELASQGSSTSSSINLKPIASQKTVDIGPRTIQKRLLDPLVLGLGAALLVCILIILIMALRH